MTTSPSPDRYQDLTEGPTSEEFDALLRRLRVARSTVPKDGPSDRVLAEAWSALSWCRAALAAPSVPPGPARTDEWDDATADEVRDALIEMAVSASDDEEHALLLRAVDLLTPGAAALGAGRAPEPVDAMRDLHGRLTAANEVLCRQRDERRPDSTERARLDGKAEGVRLALSYVNETRRDAGQAPPEPAPEPLEGTPSVAGWCTICASQIDDGRFFRDIADRLLDRGLCYECAYWTDEAKTAKAKPGRFVSDDWVIYQIGNGGGRVKGCAGQRWVIRFTDGTERRTDDLWIGQKVPERHRHLFTITAAPPLAVEEPETARVWNCEVANTASVAGERASDICSPEDAHRHRHVRGCGWLAEEPPAAGEEGR